MKYELWYAQFRPSEFNPNEQIGERKTEIIEANSAEEAEEIATRFLAGRKRIALFPFRIATSAVQPKPGFKPMDEQDHYERF